jgi:hypothetical protein
MEMRRDWAMPTKWTFDCPPIYQFIEKYYKAATSVLEPFKGHSSFESCSNDIDRDIEADYHEDVLDFLQTVKDQPFDLVLFDPPFSPRQMRECYRMANKPWEQSTALRTSSWKAERDCIANMIRVDSWVLSFGWNSTGMGKARGFALEELLLVCHGAAHNDTICIAEKKVSHQIQLFPDGARDKHRRLT